MKKNVLALLTLAVSLSPVAVASGQTLSVKVSDTLLPLNQKWAEAYQAKHAGAAIQVTSDSTAAAFAALAEKAADLVIVARSMRYREAQACAGVYGQRPPEAKLAVSGLAVYVNTNNPVKELDYEGLYGIFHGQTKNWNELDGGKAQPISVFVLATNTVAGELFSEEVMSGKEFAAEARPLAVPDLLQAVAADPNGIGFGPLTPAAGIQPLDIKRARSSTPVNPTSDNIARRIYPISRYVFSYRNPAANAADVQAYLDWIRGHEGQQVAREAGFYALPDDPR